MGRQDETDHCDDTHAVHIELSFPEDECVDWDAYMKPRAKITVSSIFLRVAICIPQTIGIGKTRMIKSTAILQLLIAIRYGKVFTQTPGSRGCHILESGRQDKRTMRINDTPKADTRTITAYAILRKFVFERKRVIRKCTMEILTDVLAAAHRASEAIHALAREVSMCATVGQELTSSTAELP